MKGEALAERLRWAELPQHALSMLAGRLRELYGQALDDGEVFDNLDVDKQQSLLIFARRFSELGLWDEIESVLNVYGEGGVGLSFKASPQLLEILRGRKDFTRKFARHRRHSAGFIELGRRRAALHLLYAEANEPQWSAHFDLYGPATSRSALLHFWSEKLRRKTPDWREIRTALWGDWKSSDK